MRTDCAILIPSCDAYADVWPLFFHGLQTCWPDCPYPIYFGTNERADVMKSVITLQSKEGLVWSNRMLDYLRRIDTPYVLLMLEDFILRKPVSTVTIGHGVAFCLKEGVDCLRLVPRPPPQTSRQQGECWHEVLPGESYRISTQAAIWRREYLLEMLRPSESIWQFEMDGTKRAAGVSARIWAPYCAMLPYEGLLAHHVIEKGRWISHERWILRWRGYPAPSKVRPSMTAFQMLCYQVGESLVRLSRLIGESRIVRWREKLRAMLPTRLQRLYQEARSGKCGR